MSYEYKVVKIDSGMFEDPMVVIQRTLNEHAVDGWRFCQVLLVMGSGTPKYAIFEKERAE